MSDHTHEHHAPHPHLTSKAEDDTDQHSHHDYHVEPVEVVDARQRMAVWLFIGGDIVGMSALLFTYLYLRGVNTGGHWMSMLGYVGHSYAYYYNILDVKGGSLPNPTLIHVGTLSSVVNWTISLVVVVSAALIWLAERGLRATKNARSYASLSALATAVIVVGIILSIVQLRSIPQIFVANNDSQVMAYTSYDSAMMAVVGSGLIHLAVLFFLGLGVTIRSARGVLTGEKWYQARLVRLFWVWVATSFVIISFVTTTITTVH